MDIPKMPRRNGESGKMDNPKQKISIFNWGI